MVKTRIQVGASNRSDSNLMTVNQRNTYASGPAGHGGPEGMMGTKLHRNPAAFVQNLLHLRTSRGIAFLSASNDV
jgi:hypothetical protein